MNILNILVSTPLANPATMVSPSVPNTPSFSTSPQDLRDDLLKKLPLVGLPELCAARDVAKDDELPLPLDRKSRVGKTSSSLKAHPCRSEPKIQPREKLSSEKHEAEKIQARENLSLRNPKTDLTRARDKSDLKPDFITKQP
ncbi:hypothetical protein GOBAR_AA26555 [Gossypium barbadense]|uniref:Uncharacterized protein n=1 Tax=Gossypium barbadense TaxID=3634 RepID=A0A2P5WST2_GOSBA|nr:hypothetical protein GOBAR_AA26555 [Gossypium barbadense]